MDVNLRLVDVNLENASINQNEIIKKINKKTRAIIVVNLWGFSANYKNLKKICKKRKNYFNRGCGTIYWLN